MQTGLPYSVVRTSLHFKERYEMVKFRQQAQKSHPTYAVKIFFGISASWPGFLSPGGVSGAGPWDGLQAGLEVCTSSKRSVSGEAVQQKENLQGGDGGKH